MFPLVPQHATRLTWPPACHRPTPSCTHSPAVLNLCLRPLDPCLLQPEGEYREYYLPLSKEEIERDLEHLGSLLQVRPLAC